MARFCSVYRHVPHGNVLSRIDRTSTAVPQPFQPPRNGRRGKYGYSSRKCLQGIERQVIGMRMRDEDSIDMRQLVERNARSADSREEAAEGGVEIGVGEENLATDLN